MHIRECIPVRPTSAVAVDGICINGKAKSTKDNRTMEVRTQSCQRPFFDCMSLECLWAFLIVL